jgi:hypothetical protein
MPNRSHPVSDHPHFSERIHMPLTARSGQTRHADERTVVNQLPAGSMAEKLTRSGRITHMRDPQVDDITVCVTGGHVMTWASR